MKFGKAFGDYIRKGKRSRNLKTVNSLLTGNETSSSWRLFVLFLVFVLGFVLLEARLFNLTVIHGTRNRLLSESNRTREQIIYAPRGIIFDRNGIPLIRNIPVYTAVGSTCEVLRKKRHSCQSLTLSAMKDFEINQSSPDVNLSIGRSYPYASASAHLLGYVGEADESELREQNQSCPENRFCHLALGELVGRGGVEEQYDDLLRGVSGRELIEVDAFGSPVRVIGKVEPTKGENLTLTIDSKLQNLISSIIASRSAAVVISEPSTGDILALSSSPSFDPNLFAQGDPLVDEIINRSDKPLFNRAISGMYPPGSTFKIVTAVAALQERSIDADTEFEDIGVIVVGPYRFPNWYFTQYGKTDGFVNVVRALARSNDIFFYRAGNKVGIMALASWARIFGIGKPLGIDLPGEQSGFMPDPDWKKKVQKEQWFTGDTYHVSIGQGNLLTTPLQVNAWTNAIANGGKICRPSVTSDQKQPKDEFCHDLHLRQQTIDLIKEGMKEACQPGGTGWPLFHFGIRFDPDGDKKGLHNVSVDNIDFIDQPISTGSAHRRIEISVACKTGTAEFGDPDGHTHAWFTAFAPVQKPQISVTVLVESGGEGSNVAAPIAKKIFEYWFSQ